MKDSDQARVGHHQSRVFILGLLMSGSLLGACGGKDGLAGIPFFSAWISGGQADRAFTNALNAPGALPADVLVRHHHPVSPPGDPSIPVRGIIATRQVIIGRTAVADADVSVIGTEGHVRSHRSGGSHPLVLENDARIAAERTARATGIRLHRGAAILGVAEYNTVRLDRGARINESRRPLEAVPLLPPFLEGSPGRGHVTRRRSPLPPGKYGEIRSSGRTSLVLSGGVYHLRAVRIEGGGQVVCLSSCILLIRERLTVGNRGNLAAASGKSNDLIVYVEGRGIRSENASVLLGQRSRTLADIYTRGRGVVESGARLSGNLIADHVELKTGAHVVSGGAIRARAAALLRAGVAGSVELPGEVRLDVPACALSEDVVITIASVGPVSGPPLGAPSYRAFGQAYELEPSGLEFSCPTSMQIQYDPAVLNDAGLAAANVRILTSRDGSAYEVLPGTPGNAYAQADVSHFSLFLVASFGAESATSLIVRGNYAYVASASAGGLLVLDISNPANPVEAGRAAGTGAMPGAIALSGNQAHIANLAGNLDTYDISDPSAPILLGSYNPGAQPLVASQMSVRGDLLLLPVLSDSVQALRLGAGAPTLSHKIPMTGQQTAAVFAGNNAYSCGLANLKVLSGSANAVINTIGTNGYLCTDLDVANGHIFVTSHIVGAGQVWSALSVISISGPDSPQAPRVVTTMAPPQPGTYFSAVRVRGPFAFLSYAGVDATTNTVTDKGGMLVVDVSNPAAPVIVRDDDFPTGGPREASAFWLDIKANYAYVAAESGVQVVDISAYPPAPAPTNLTVRPADGAVFLDWNDVPGAIGYRVYRSDDGPDFPINTARSYLSAISELYLATGGVGQPRYFVVRAILPGEIETEATPVIGAMSAVGWTQMASGIPRIFHSVAYGNGRFVAAGNNPFGSGDGYYSDDASTWLAGSGLVPTRGVTFAAGNFVGLTQSPTTTGISISSDGATWTAPVTVPAALVAAGHGAGRYVAVGFGGAIWSSPDGVNWSPSTSGTACHLSAIAWSGTEFVAVSGIGGCGVALRSVDGLSWSTVSLPRAVIYEDIIFGAGEFVAVGFSGAIVASANGTVWEDRSPQTSLVLRTVAYGGGYYVVLGAGEYALASLDGRQWLWTNAPRPYPRSCINDLIFAQSKFVGVGEDCSGSGQAVIVVAPPWDTGID